MNLEQGLFAALVILESVCVGCGVYAFVLLYREFKRDREG